MKNAYKQKRTEGFTIIEVLIVLAIAALIFLIVFLAVPALQRNARNNGIKNDAANLLAGVSTFESNNSGQLPTGVSATSCLGTGGTVTFQGAAGTQTNDVSIQPTTKCSVVTANPAFPGTTGNVVLAMNFKCNGNTGTTANPRSVSALFLVETGGSSTATQCVES